MNKLDENKLFELYTLAEISYQNHFKEFYRDIDLLYPDGWYEKKNYKEKIEILTEAIKNNQLIVNTSKYQAMIECVKKYVKE